jgi:CO/xanthine dehydrogenase Mo-binding subunit
MAQVVAEEFGLTVEDIHICTGDSKSVGYSDGAAGSRVARTMTAALVEASQDALGQLRRRAAESCNARPSSSTMRAARSGRERAVPWSRWPNRCRRR